jgi:hypothetical protein
MTQRTIRFFAPQFAPWPDGHRAFFAFRRYTGQTGRMGSPACAAQLRARSTCGLPEMDRKVESRAATKAAIDITKGIDGS